MNKIIAMLFALLLLPIAAKAQNVVPANEMYMFGVAFTPLDSVVYITELQTVKGTRVFKKTKFLENRSEYSSQLKRFIINAGLDRMTTAVSFSPKRSKAEKKYIRMKQKYQKRGFVVKHITSTDFAFKEIEVE